jgi:hypothetical protein
MQPLTQTQRDEAINVFNKPFESLTLEEAFQLGVFLSEETEEYNPYLYENTQEDINLEADLAGENDRE